MGFVYQHITMEDRAQIGLVALLQQGTYGLVTGLARDLGTSRKFVYTLTKRVRTAVEEALAPRSPGPAPCSQTIIVDRQRLDRAIVTLGLVAHASQRAIADCLGEIYEVEPSLGYINGVLSLASKAAADFNEKLRLMVKDAQVEADELFALGKAHLVAVDHRSLLILALRQVQHCNVEAWQQELTKMSEKGVELRRLGSDGGQALGKAVAQMVELNHQLDLWHALLHVGRAKRNLEQAAYKALGKEWELEKKAKGMNPNHAMGGEVWRLYREAKVEAEKRIEKYEQLHILNGWVREALDAVERVSGRIRNRQECMAELKAVTELMREMKVDVVRKLADYLDKAGPGLLEYAEKLGAVMKVLSEEMGEEGVRRLCREWEMRREMKRVRRPDEKAACRLAYERAHLLALLHWGNDYKNAHARVVGVLEGIMRGSSLAECVNSWLRPYADLMKGIKEQLLPLFMLYRNSHVFERGKRAGHSPLELAGIKTPQGTFLDWLGLERQQAPLKSVRSLPKPA